MNEAVLDTHALIWYLENSPRLSLAARQAITGAISRGNRLAISTVSLAEVLYLKEKGRFRPGTFSAIRAELQTSGSALNEIHVSGEIIEAMRQVRRELVPDLPDRIIAATSVYLRIPWSRQIGKSTRRRSRLFGKAA